MIKISFNNKNDKDQTITFDASYDNEIEKNKILNVLSELSTQLNTMGLDYAKPIDNNKLSINVTNCPDVNQFLKIAKPFMLTENKPLLSKVGWIDLVSSTPGADTKGLLFSLLDLTEVLIQKTAKENLGLRDRIHTQNTNTFLNTLLKPSPEKLFEKHFPEEYQKMKEAEENNQESKLDINYKKEFDQYMEKEAKNLTQKSMQILILIKEGDLQGLRELKTTQKTVPITTKDILEGLFVIPSVKTPVDYANQYKSQAILDHFYHIAKKNFEDKEGKIDTKKFHANLNILHWAVFCKQSPTEITAILKDAPELINIPHKFHPFNTPLDFAIRTDNLEMVKFLSEQVNFDITALNNETNDTTLHRAIVMPNAHPHILNFLFEDNKIDINAVNSYHRTPLLHAAWLNKPDQIKTLCRHPKVNLSAKDDEGYTSLHLAAQRGQAETVEFLLSQSKTKQLDINAQMNDNSTPLIRSIHRHNINIVKMLGDHKDIKVNESTLKGETALHRAATFDDIEIVKYLCSHKDIFINAQLSDTHETALHLAAKAGRLDICKVLIDHGINITAINNKNKTAYQAALVIEPESSSEDDVNDKIRETNENRMAIAEYLEPFEYPKILNQVYAKLEIDLKQFSASSDSSQIRKTSAQEMQKNINESHEEKIPTGPSESIREAAKNSMNELINRLVEHKNVQEKIYKKNNPLAHMGVKKNNLVEIYKEALKNLPSKLVDQAEEKYLSQQSKSSNKMK